MTPLDELEAVRRVGASAAEPDPEARERVRARIAPTPRRRRRWPFALVPAGAVALGVALMVALTGPQAEFAGPSQSTVPPTEQTAAPDLFPRPDQYLYVRSRNQHQACREGARPECRTPEPSTREIWVSSGRGGVLRDNRESIPGGEIRLGRTQLSIGNHEFTHDELARYDPTPRELLLMLIRERPAGQGGDSPLYPFVQITDALRERPMPPRVRKALVEALPLVTGVTRLGPMTDSEGRQGVGYVRDNDQVIIDPERNVMLEERNVTAGGDVVGRGVYLDWEVVDEAP